MFLVFISSFFFLFHQLFMLPSFLATEKISIHNSQPTSQLQ
jgi:hypothetical protein